MVRILFWERTDVRETSGEGRMSYHHFLQARFDGVFAPLGLIHFDLDIR